MFRSNSSWEWNKPYGKNKIGIDSLKVYEKEFIKNNKLISKAQQILRSEHFYWTNWYYYFKFKWW